MPEPYPGWREQMTRLRALARPGPPALSAVLRQPAGANENHGDVHLPLAAGEAREALLGGTYSLVSYTFSKIMTSGTDNIQRERSPGAARSGVISPFEQERNRVLAADDVTHVLSAALVYELPFGRARIPRQGGIANAMLGGWQLSTVFRYSSGLPFFFRVELLQRARPVPGRLHPGDQRLRTLRAGPGQLRSRRKGPLFDKNAFESVDAFNFYYGYGTG